MEKNWWCRAMGAEFGWSILGFCCMWRKHDKSFCKTSFSWCAYGTPGSCLGDLLISGALERLGEILKHEGLGGIKDAIDYAVSHNLPELLFDLLSALLAAGIKGIFWPLALFKFVNCWVCCSLAKQECDALAGRQGCEDESGNFVNFEDACGNGGE
jgi:hypothetical protein